MKLAETLRWPVLAEPRSGVRSNRDDAVRHADAFLRHEPTAQSLRPEVVLRFGATPASKVVNTWLRDCEGELVVVGASSFLIDPDRRCAMHVVAAPDTVCNDLVSVERGRPAPVHWRDAWVGIERTTRETIAGMLDDEQSLSEPGTARMVAE